MTLKGVFIKRENRFTCLVKVRGKIKKAYLPNTGRLDEVLSEGSHALLLPKKGKLPYKLIAMKKDNIWVSVDSHLVNSFFIELIKTGLPFLKGWNISSREIKTNGGRIDFLLKKGSRELFCEIKSCTLVERGIAMFPDAPTLRGVRHIETLIEKKKERFTDSMIIFIAQREDAKDFAPNPFTHPLFARTLFKALFQGLRAFLVVSVFDPKILKNSPGAIPLTLLFWKELKPLNLLINEFHLWRYPEVEINIKRRKSDISLRMTGTTCLHCSFEENFYDFLQFAKERGFNFRVKEILSLPGEVRAKIEENNKNLETSPDRDVGRNPLIL